MKTIIAVLFLAVGPAWALTCKDIIVQSRKDIQDEGITNSQFVILDETMIRMLNDGQREANAYAWLLNQRYTFTLTGGTTEYALPSDFMASQRVMFRKTGQSNWSKIDQTSFNQLDAESMGWMGMTCGLINKYYVWVTTTPVIGFTPCPVSASTGTVHMDYVAETIDMNSLDDVPFNGFGILSPYHQSLVYYLDCRSLRILGKPDAATPYCSMWEQAILMMKSGLLKQPDFNPSFGGLRNQ